MEQLLRDVMTCPLTAAIMQDPVFAADGFVYERTAIEEWIKEHGLTSPVTHEAMEHPWLTPAACMKILKELYVVAAAHATPLRLHGSHIRVFEIARDHVGFVIGRGGRTIRNISAQTGTHMSIDQRPRIPVLTLVGGDIDHALTLLDEVIKKSVMLKYRFTSHLPKTSL